MDRINYDAFEQQAFRYVDQIKDFLSPKIWQSILLDCTKNEIFVLWLLFRKREVNMSTIAEYIDSPLNTATGIINRMEKKKLVERERSLEDKRVVTIRLGQNGMAQTELLLKEFMYYGQKVLEEFKQEEIDLMLQLMERFIKILKEKKMEDTTVKVRKILIE